MKVLLGVTGSVAAKLTGKMVKKLEEDGHEVVIVATKSSLYFWNPTGVGVRVCQDADEWPGEKYDPDIPVLHIELREWADILLIAPITYNTIAKISHGLADNLLTCIVAAWDRNKPIVIAPAMNTKMWENPFADLNIHTLKLEHTAGMFTVVSPIAGKLACGETGIGAMAHIDTIIEAVNYANIKD